MGMVEDFDKIAGFYICSTVVCFVKGPRAMRIAKAKGWSKAAKGQKRQRYDLWIIEYTDGVRELYRHVSGKKPEMLPSPTLSDIISAFRSVDAKPRKDVTIIESEPVEYCEQMKLFY